MALIIPHNSQTGINVATGGKAANTVGASAFTTPGQSAMPGALEHLAKGINKLGGAIFDAEIHKRKEQMELALLEDMQAFQSEAQARDDAYRQENQGKNAVNADADASAFYKEKTEALLKKWEGNGYAQLYIQRNAGGMAVSGVNAMRDYGARQQEAWKDSVFAGEAAAFKDVATDWRSTPEQVQGAWRNYSGKNVAYLRSKGLDPAEARIRTDRVYRDAVSEKLQHGFIARINNNDLEGAKRDLALMRGDFPEITDGNMKEVIAAYVDHPNVRSFLNFIAASEGTAGRGDDGYNILFGGSTFDDYSKHPNVRRDFRQTDGKTNVTTAAGRYQFVNSTWNGEPGKPGVAQQMGLSDMSPRSQDLAAVYLMLKRGALKDVVEGNAEAAIEKLGKEWASLPSSPYAQPKHSTQNAAAMLEAAGFAKGGLVSPEKIAAYEKTLAAATADNKVQSYMARLESGEDEQEIRKEILALPQKERGPVKSLFNAHRAVWKEEQREKVQDGIIDNRMKMNEMTPGQAYRFVEAMPETTWTERKTKQQARADYGVMAAHAGLSRTTDPSAYNALVDAIAYPGEPGGIRSEKDLRAHPEAAKVSKENLDKLARDLKEASTIKDLKTAYRWAIGKDGDSPEAGKLDHSEEKDFMRFSQWAAEQAKSSNRAKEPEYVRDLARQWRMRGETKSWFGYGPDKRFGTGGGKEDPTWLPDLEQTFEDYRPQIDRVFRENPEMAAKWTAQYGGDAELGKRGYLKALQMQNIGPKKRPAGADKPTQAESE